MPGRAQSSAIKVSRSRPTRKLTSPAATARDRFLMVSIRLPVRPMRLKSASAKTSGRGNSHCRPSGPCTGVPRVERSEEHTSELQSRENLVCRLLLEKKKYNQEKQ